MATPSGTYFCDPEKHEGNHVRATWYVRAVDAVDHEFMADAAASCDDHLTGFLRYLLPASGSRSFVISNLADYWKAHDNMTDGQKAAAQQT